MVSTHPSTIAVLGAGSWGTALALLLVRNGHWVRLWSHSPAQAELLQRARENNRYLPGFVFPATLKVQSRLSATLQEADIVLMVVPSHAYRETLVRLKTHYHDDMGFVWATKGLERGTGHFLHQVTAQILGRVHRSAVISGPSFAREVAAGLPTAITVASWDGGFAAWLAALLHGSNLRAYTSEDVIGVELGGALKNVLAIAAGVSDGLGFGANARAALITRGLAEMVRLGEAVGGRRETLMGLAGVGDLVLTCTDNQSRNRRFGLAIGRGQTVQQALDTIGQVVEGAAITREMVRMARQHGVEMPITEQVDRVLHQGLEPRQAVEALLARDLKAETF